MVAISFCHCTLSLICGPKGLQKYHQSLSQGAAYRVFDGHCTVRRDNTTQVYFREKGTQFHVLSATKGSAKSSEPEEKVPSWAQPDANEPPPWAREDGKANESKEGFEPPFFVYLLASAVTAIAAIGSIFEYVNQKPVFGLLSSDSIFYAPVLGFFAFTGIPTSAFLWYKSVQTANKEAEEQDRRDGFR